MSARKLTVAPKAEAQLSDLEYRILSHIREITDECGFSCCQNGYVARFRERGLVETFCVDSNFCCKPTDAGRAALAAHEAAK